MFQVPLEVPLRSEKLQGKFRFWTNNPQESDPGTNKWFDHSGNYIAADGWLSCGLC